MTELENKRQKDMKEMENKQELEKENRKLEAKKIK